MNVGGLENRPYHAVSFRRLLVQLNRKQIYDIQGFPLEISTGGGVYGYSLRINI